MTPLLIEFSPDSEDLLAIETSCDGTILMTVDGTPHELSRSDVVALRESLEDALTDRHEFVYTAGTHREDGTYVVSRRGADSTGNEKVFESFETVRRLYDRLPDRFGADDVSRSGITGSRRHMLVRHYAEHPAFPCRIVERCPLTVEKREDERHR